MLSHSAAYHKKGCSISASPPLDLQSDAERSEEVQEKAKPYFVRRWGSDVRTCAAKSSLPMPV